MRTPSDPGQTALVTGGGGFIGSAVVAGLIKEGWRVRSFSRQRHPAVERLGAESVRGDVCDQEAITAACVGCDAVVHTAAIVPSATRKGGLFHLVNVGGTENVIRACQQSGVGRLVFTSSPSVVFAGEDHEGVDETTGYAERYHSPYAHTKAIAERRVLSANSPQLATVALRPHLVWGPGDPHLIPQIIDRARRGRLARIGHGRFRVGATYIDNAAAAHIDAIVRLGPDTACAGKAYFISQDEPVDLWEFVNRVLTIAGIEPVTRVVPRWLALLAASVVELVYALARARSAPPLTRFIVHELSSSHWYDIGAARRDLGYVPAVSVAEGLRRLAADWASH